MKTKYTMAALLIGISAASMAQENDDMYFNSKDRAKTNEVNAAVLAKRYYQDDLNAVKTNPVNPSDSYTGRGVNPEYNAQAKNGTSLVQNNPDYFVSNYQPKNVNSSLYNGTNSSYCNCNSAYGNNSMYSPYGMGYGGMGYGYSPYGMGYGGYGYSPYSSMSMGFGSMYGSPYSSMMMSYGMGSMYGMGGMYGMGSMYGMGYGYSPYGYGYGSTVIINNGDGSSGVVSGRHPSRSSGLNNYVSNNRSASVVTGNGTGRVQSAGRTGSNNYYDNNWRSNPNNSTSRSSYYNTGGNTSRSGNSGWGNSGSRSSFDSGSGSSFGGGRSSSFGGGSFGGGGGSSGGGGGGGGHSRGR